IVPRGMEAPIELALKEDVDAVLPLIGIDGPLIDLGKMKDQLEEEYGIPVIASNEFSASISSSKKKTKEFFLKNKIETPDYQIINQKNASDFDNTSQIEMEYPSVLKQNQGQGGVGIIVAQNKNDAEDYFQKYDETIVEKYIKGYEISVEVLKWQEKSIPLVAVFKGETTIDGTHPLDKIKNAPADIPGLSNELAREMALKITNLMGSEGNTDVDMIFEPSSGNLYAIEMNTRPSGTRYLTAASSDIHPLHQMVDMATGDWDVKNVENNLKKYFAIEVPVGVFKGPKTVPSSQIFNGFNSWVAHGPKNYERVTIRSENKNDLYKTAKNLKIII
ncbi:MAG: ATP-grasp domain-containing protein, partial [Methanobacteriaceae archaeon]|nr:ATP-grasp domain-containing protein [Methanobacteriaceae archaeon]